jgi:hypothetical protein
MNIKMEVWHRMCQTLDWGICNSQLARYVDFWGLLTEVSWTCLTVSADGPGRPVCFAVHRQPLCWKFLYHSRIVLSVGGCMWYLVWNLCCSITIDSVLANPKTQNAFLLPVFAVFHHNCPLAVKPASMPWHLLFKQTGRDFICIDIVTDLLKALSYGARKTHC